MPKSILFPALAKELAAMARADQRMRNGYLKDRQSSAWDPDLDRRHALRLSEIIAQIGWPSVSKVGAKASRWAWLLAQHADHDLAFQKDCLERMKSEPEGEVDRGNIAYLEDRIAVSENRPQPYGTQFRGDRPHPILEPENLELRRKSMGLGSFEEYEQQMAGA